MGLTTLTSFLGMGMMASGSRQSSPSNVTYQGDTVYINGQPTASQEQYYQQALNLAYQNAPGAQPYQSAYAPASGNNANFAPAQVNPAGPADENSLASGSAEEWQPLGVFALAEPSQTDSNMLLQLAINKQGNVRGNYMNQLTNERSQVFGSLDKQTQRLSWRIGDNSSTVFDTSLNDIVKDDSQVLVHYGPTNTREMALIRLNGPANQSPGDGNSLPAQGTSVGPSG